VGLAHPLEPLSVGQSVQRVAVSDGEGVKWHAALKFQILFGLARAEELRRPAEF
jgi:hypothetical protein